MTIEWLLGIIGILLFIVLIANIILINIIYDQKKNEIEYLEFMEDLYKFKEEYQTFKKESHLQWGEFIPLRGAKEEIIQPDRDKNGVNEFFKGPKKYDPKDIKGEFDGLFGID